MNNFLLSAILAMFMSILPKTVQKYSGGPTPSKQSSIEDNVFRSAPSRCRIPQHKGNQQAKSSQEDPSKSSNNRFEFLENLENLEKEIVKGRGIVERSHLQHRPS